MAKPWFIKTKDGQAGPYSLKQLKELAKSGKLKERMQISRDGIDWIAAGNVEALGFAVAAPAASLDPLLQDDSEAVSADAKRKPKSRGHGSQGRLAGILELLFVEFFSLKWALVTALFSAVGLFFVWGLIAINIMPFIVGAGLEESALGKWSDGVTEMASSAGTLRGFFYAWLACTVIGGILGTADK